MKNGGKLLILAAGVCGTLALAAHGAIKVPHADDQEADAQTADNPYSAIINRNIFDLHDPPPPNDANKPPKEPPANVKLTGITTIFGNKQALFILNESGAPGRPPYSHSAILSEGQRSGVLEVLAINPKARSATIKNDGKEFTLNIETNKAAPAAAPGPPGAHAGGYAPPPGGKFPGYGRGAEALPVRPVRSEPQQPNYGYGGATVTPQSAPPTQQQQLTPQEQWTLMEAQRAQSQAGAADPNFQIMLPPTPLSQGASQPTQPTSTGEQAPPSPTSTLPAALQPRSTLHY